MQTQPEPKLHNFSKIFPDTRKSFIINKKTLFGPIILEVCRLAAVCHAHSRPTLGVISCSTIIRTVASLDTLFAALIRFPTHLRCFVMTIFTFFQWFRHLCKTRLLNKFQIHPHTSPRLSSYHILLLLLFVTHTFQSFLPSSSRLVLTLKTDFYTAGQDQVLSTLS